MPNNPNVASPAQASGASHSSHSPHGSPSSADPGPSRPRFGDLPKGSGESILLVDDEATVLKVTCRLLEKLGYHVRTAAAGPEALEIFEATPDGFDLVLTDVVMPRMTGIELARRIRLSDPDQPILFTSGYTTREYGNAPDEPPRPFMPKPFSMAEIAHAVKDVIGD